MPEYIAEAELEKLDPSDLDNWQLTIGKNVKYLFDHLTKDK